MVGPVERLAPAVGPLAVLGGLVHAEAEAGAPQSLGDGGLVGDEVPAVGALAAAPVRAEVEVGVVEADEEPGAGDVDDDAGSAAERVHLDRLPGAGPGDGVVGADAHRRRLLALGERDLDDGAEVVELVDVDAADRHVVGDGLGAGREPADAGDEVGERPAVTSAADVRQGEDDTLVLVVAAAVDLALEGADADPPVAAGLDAGVGVGPHRLDLTGDAVDLGVAGRRTEQGGDDGAVTDQDAVG